MATTVDNIYLSDILNAPLEIDQDPDSENFTFTPPTIFNSKRRIIYLDSETNTEKLYKLNPETNQLEIFSFKINLDMYKAPLPTVIGSNFSVYELNNIAIPIDNSNGLDINVSCQLGTVQYADGKISYTAPSLSNITNYVNYSDYSKIGTDNIIITATKIGYISNELQIPIDILKFDISEDDALIDDDFSTFITFTDNVEIV